MKMLTLCLTVILITTFTSLLYSVNLPSVQLEGANTTLNGFTMVLGKKNIFYQDPDNNILLIDFKEVNSKLAKVTVRRAKELLMEDKVGDLAIDSIYELDLNTYGKGVFTITLTTVEEEQIAKEVIIE